MQGGHDRNSTEVLVTRRISDKNIQGTCKIDSNQLIAVCSSFSIAISTARFAHSRRSLACLRRLKDSMTFCWISVCFSWCGIGITVLATWSGLQWRMTDPPTSRLICSWVRIELSTSVKYSFPISSVLLFSRSMPPAGIIFSGVSRK